MIEKELQIIDYFCFIKKLRPQKKDHFSSTFDSKYFVNKQKTENQNKLHTKKLKSQEQELKPLIKLFYLHTGNENTKSLYTYYEFKRILTSQIHTAFI